MAALFYYIGKWRSALTPHFSFFPKNICRFHNFCVTSLIIRLITVITTTIMAEEKTRYNDAELEEFRILIEQKLASARADYDMLRTATSNENDTEDSSPTFKVMEEGATTLSREEYGSLAQRQAKFIRNLEMALVRIKNKTYGICKTTGKLIPRERLLRVPHATECIEAKQARK